LRAAALRSIATLGSIASLRLVAAGFAAAAFAWGSLAGCTLTRVPAPSRSRAEPASTVYVVRRKWHIEVGFAAADLGPLASVSAEFPGAKYVFFGFGDRHYLLARNHEAPVLSGALWPGPALILLTALRDTPAAGFGGSQVVALELSAAQTRAVQSFIRGSIAELGPYAPAPYAKGPYEGSLFYAASARYSAFHTCNTWAAEALLAGDVPVRSRGVIFASQLWSQVGKLAQDSTAAPASIPAPEKSP
jgi:Protein of unknown function (DUF2459)